MYVRCIKSLNKANKRHRKEKYRASDEWKCCLLLLLGKSNRMEEIFMRTVTETYNVYTYPELS